MARRPTHLTPPVLPPNPPVPTPEAIERPAKDQLGRDPVRYGDWERNGIAVDF